MTVIKLQFSSLCARVSRRTAPSNGCFKHTEGHLHWEREHVILYSLYFLTLKPSYHVLFCAFSFYNLVLYFLQEVFFYNI